MTEPVHLDDLEHFDAATGARIRDLAHPEWTAAKAMSLAEATLEAGAETQEHYHPISEEIYHFTNGAGRVRINDVEFDVQAGHAVVIPPGAPHKIWNTGDQDLVLLCCCSPAYQHDDTVLTGR